MFNKKLNTDSFTNLIAEGTSISGEVMFTGTMKIEGNVSGTTLAGITDTGVKGAKLDCVILTKSGIIQSTEIKTGDIIIAGQVTSKTIWAEDTVRILASAKITGSKIYYRTLEIEPGGIIHECELKHLDYSSEGEIV